MGARHRLASKLFLICLLTPALRSNVSMAILAIVDDEFSETFHLNEQDQELIFQSYFWGYLTSPLPAGLLACKYGGKWVGGLAMAFTGLLSIALPQAVTLGGRDFLILIRILQGFSSGFVVTALALLSKWTPSNERAYLCSMCISGIPLGRALMILVSSYLIPKFGWPFVFYLPGIIAIVYFPIWCATVYPSPQDDPTISPEELKYLQGSQTNCFSKEITLDQDMKEIKSTNLAEIPWKLMISSVPYWAAFTSQLANISSNNSITFFNVPKYFQTEFLFDVQAYGHLSALRYTSQFLFMIGVGYVSDYLIERKYLWILNSRKLCNSIGQWGSALFLGGLIFARCADCSVVLLLSFIFSGMMNGAMVSGSFVNIIDISPKYSSLNNGIINFVANVAGMRMIHGTRLIFCNGSSVCNWQYVFFVPIILNIVGNLVFVFGAAVDVQPWNFSEKKTVNLSESNSSKI